ncbi:MAG: M15 family metallopeptidase [Clostridia bacterium]|nr:M15 family metallopeptidase [Clostridia bacterium]
MKDKKQKIFSIIGIAVICLVIGFIGFVIFVVFTPQKDSTGSENMSSSQKSESDENTSSVTSSPQNSAPEYVTRGEYTLDASFSNLLLVNPWNPLSDDYNIEENLVEIDKKYRNNDYVYKIHKDVYPYVKAMVEAAHKDGVDLRVWSPYRSYKIQQDLFKNKVERVLKANPSLTREQAENEAATVVARPGTSEHQTGLAADFNMASSKFDTTDYYKWMLENAEDYGFIQRYTAEKQEKTGIIPESWHWRFVGINKAKEINDLGMCLEEYIIYLQNTQQ